MSWDGRDIVRFPFGCVRSSAFGVGFSKVGVLHSLVALLLGLVLGSGLVLVGVTWVSALWDAELIDLDSLEWELAGVWTFRNIGVVFSKVVFSKVTFLLHALALLDLVLGSGLVVWDSEVVDSDLLEWELAGVWTFGIIASNILVWIIMSCGLVWIIMSCDRNVVS